MASELPIYTKRQKIWIALAAGLYPLLHYYNSNFDIADSAIQWAFLLGICVVFPLVSVFVFPMLLKWKPNAFLKKRYLASINMVVFFGLVALLVFMPNDKTLAVVLILAGLLGFVVYRWLWKIVILQLLLAVMSLITLVPRIGFLMEYSEDWALPSDQIAQTDFTQKPNIYVIQPDGYVNFSRIDQPPYFHNDLGFRDWLTDQGFTHYPDFRSNYYSTVATNSAMFAMRHHYYSNTYSGNLKTYGAQQVIVGKNTTLDALKHNGYTTHLLTDNTFFLMNRKLAAYDHCNVPPHRMSMYDTGGVYGIDIAADLEASLRSQGTEPQFYFIEKTIPGHIMYTEGPSLGAAGEREAYFERMATTDEWLKTLIGHIDRFDPGALIVIVADHGGFVGLDFYKEAENRRLDEAEAWSAFSSLLAIRWPEGLQGDRLDIKSNVNLFRSLFSVLAQDPDLLNSLEDDGSYIPLYEGSRANFYQVLDGDDRFEYRLLE